MDTRSWNVLMKSVEFDNRYESTVQDIYRDMNSNWNLNYYADSSTSWDFEVAKTKIEIQNYMDSNKTNEALLQKCKEQLACSRLEQTDKNYIKLNNKQKEDINTKYATAIDVINENNRQLELLKPLSKEQIWKQHVERVINTNLKILRDKFRIDGDDDFLRRGVTFTMANCYKMLDIVKPVHKEETSAW
jgi:hypothetical protein